MDMWRNSRVFVKRTLRKIHRDQAGATMLEWTLLLAAIALPSYWTIKLALATLIGYYQMMTTLNALPFP